MIESFRCKETEKIFFGRVSKKLPTNIQRRARRRLLVLDSAKTIEDLRHPPSNHLESLKGQRKGQFSIRSNDQWRICFKHDNGKYEDVEIVDYHH